MDSIPVLLEPKEGDVLLNSTGTGTIGRSCIFNGPHGKFIVDGHVTVLRVRPDIADGRILNEFLRSSDGQRLLESRCFTGSTNQVELSRVQLGKLELPLPPLEEQRRIAEIIDTIDETIQATESVIAKQVSFYEGLASALLRGERTGGERRSVPTGWVVGRLPSLDGLPGTWRVANLSQLVGLESGHTPARNVPTYWDGAIPWLSLHDTTRLGFDVIGETTLTVSELGIRNSSARILPAGTTAPFTHRNRR